MPLAGWGHGYSVALLCLFGYTKQVLSILSQVTSGFTEPRLPYGENVQISVTVTSGRYSMKKAELKKSLGFTWSTRF